MPIDAASDSAARAGTRSAIIGHDYLGKFTDGLAANILVVWRWMVACFNAVET